MGQKPSSSCQKSSIFILLLQSLHFNTRGGYCLCVSTVLTGSGALQVVHHTENPNYPAFIFFLFLYELPTSSCYSLTWHPCLPRQHTSALQKNICCSIIERNQELPTAWDLEDCILKLNLCNRIYSSSCWRNFPVTFSYNS